jgi:Tfp pilus assembly protein PilO
MRTKNTMVGILAAVLVVALWWTMMLKPARAKASKVREQTTVQQAKLDPLEAQLHQAQEDAAHASTIKAELESLQQAMPDSPALAEFIRDANQISDQTGVSWQSVTHGPPTIGDDGVTSITLGIQVKGTYAQVMDYLTKLGALQRLVVVDGVQLSTAATTGADTAGSGAGAQTGPFSGASQLAAVISARMFESPLAAAPGTDTTGAASTATSATGTATTPAATSAPTSGNTGALNNS